MGQFEPYLETDESMLRLVVSGNSPSLVQQKNGSVVGDISTFQYQQDKLALISAPLSVHIPVHAGKIKVVFALLKSQLWILIDFISRV